MQGLRRRLPQPQRPRRGRERGGASARLHGGATTVGARATRPSPRLPPLRRAGLPHRLPARTPTRRTRSPGSCATSTTSCIGCSYCTLTCPYEVPRFDHDLGIVRKCDMCTDRLAVGEAPACVQGVPHQRPSRSTSVDVDALVSEVGADRELAPRPGRPLARPSPFPRPATAPPDPSPPTRSADDHASVHPLTRTHAARRDAGAHPGVGRRVRPRPGVAGRPGPVERQRASAVMALRHRVAGPRGARCSTSGARSLAWRAVLGLRHSWLSREIVAFSVFALAATAWAAAAVTEIGPPSATVGAAVVARAVAGVGLARSPSYATTGALVVELADHDGPVRRHHGRGRGHPAWPPPPCWPDGDGERRGRHARHAPPGRPSPRIGVLLAIAVPLLAVRRSAEPGTTAGPHPAPMLVGPLRPMLLGRVLLGLLGGRRRAVVVVAVLAASSITPTGPRAGSSPLAALVVTGGELFGAPAVLPRLRGARGCRGWPDEAPRRTLTSLLDRTPGGFGLGQLPAARPPRQVTRMMCGFCSTGCSLERPPARRRGDRPHARDRTIRSTSAWPAPRAGRR